MSKLKIAIICGGKSGEHEVSLISALSVYAACDKNKYDVTLIGIDHTGRWVLPDIKEILELSNEPYKINLDHCKKTLSLLPFKTSKQFVFLDPSDGSPFSVDCVFPVLHGTHGEDGTIQGLLELSELPYVGSGVLGSAIGMDKDVAKRLLRDAGVPVVPFLTFHKYIFQNSPELVLEKIKKTFSFPVFVKPANAGSSVGVNKIKNITEAIAKISDSFQYDNKVIIEAAIDARELECSVLGNNTPKASVVGEVIPHHEFYSYEAKYLDKNGASLKIPAELSAKEVKEIQNYAVLACLALEVAGMARVDFFMDKNKGTLYLNEINTIPGFTSISMYSKMWDASGLSYSSLIDSLISLALEKNKEKKSIKTKVEYFKK